MTDERTSEILPLTASACGKTNAFTMGCPAAQQTMSYAACLHRIKAIEGDEAPSDWAVCARSSAVCPARSMRQEEVLAGKSIYFRARQAVQAAADSVRQWVSTSNKKPGRRQAAPAHRDAFDALGSVGSLADAVNNAAAAGAAVPAAAPVVRVATPPRPMPVALPGESPLAMARRLAALKTSPL